MTSISFMFLADPGIVFALLAVACAAFVFEIANPGMVVPGGIGVGCVVAAGAGLAGIRSPVSVWGLALWVLALAALATEQTRFGGGAGAVAGALLLMAAGIVAFPAGPIPRAVLVPVPIAVGVAAVVAARTARRIRYGTQRRPVIEPGDFDGRTVVVDRVRDGRAAVRMDGAWWSAVADAPLRAGQQVRVIGREGLTLLVEPLEEAPWNR